jgi:hypothetical protein
MRRRILLAVFMLVTAVSTVAFALWYSGAFEESDCVKRGGTWVTVRKMCVVD